MFRKRGYKVYLIYERATSKTCCLCYSENKYNIIKRKDPRPWKHGQDQDVWGLSRCTNGKCRAFHNRDHCGSTNIRTIAKHIIDPKNNALPDPIDFLTSD